jgi:hypothetical protein
MRQLLLILGLFYSTLLHAVSGPVVLEQVGRCVRLAPESLPKEEMAALLQQLQLQGVVTEIGGEELRLRYINLQSCFERVFQSQSDPVLGLIVAGMPSTPLSTPVDPLDLTLLDPSLRQNPAAIFAVRTRAQALRGYLNRGHMLYVAYPEGGLQMRSPAQQNVFLAEVARFPDRLFNQPLKTPTLDLEMTGATYFFHTDDGLYLFSIQSFQPRENEKEGQWGIWFGPMSNPAMAQRADRVFSYLDPLGLKRPAGTK